VLLTLHLLDARQVCWQRAAVGPTTASARPALGRILLLGLGLA